MRWNLKPKAPKSFLNQFPEYSHLALQLLYDRGIIDQEKIDEFFNPDYASDLHDPFLMKGVKKAVGRILKAVGKKEKIVVYGDYDCDGICAIIVLTSFLQSLGANFEIYIPDREKEGYGLNEQAVEYLSKRKINLVITVDCGISNNKEVEMAKNFGMDVIITDHHQVSDKPPNAFTVIDPHQKRDNYPFKHLSGAGVAFKLAQALIKASGSKIFYDGWEKWLLDLVALATVADMMPLLGENRTLVKYGLVVLAQTKRPGLKELMKVAGIVDYKLNTVNFEQNGKSLTRREVSGIDTQSIGFALAPRLNAASRMDHATLAYKLLVSRSKREAEPLAKKLNQKNRERQNLVAKVIKEAEKNIQKKKQLIIFEKSDSWPPGIAGLVAGRIADKYWRPTFIGCRIDEEQSNFSIRSISGLNIIEPLSHCSKFFEQFGGHKQAAGLRILDKNIAKAEKCLDAFIEKKLKKEDLISFIDIDAEVKFSDLNWELYDTLRRFSPFGMANQNPKFLVKSIEVVDLKTVGAGERHLKMQIKDGKLETKALSAQINKVKNMKVIGFNLGEWSEKLKSGDRIDIVVELIVNEWNGSRELQLKLVDLRKE